MSASSRADSGRPMTTGRSSSWRGWPGGRSCSTRGSRPRSSKSRVVSRSACGGPTRILRRACASRRPFPAGASRSASPARPRASSSTRAPAWSWFCPGRPASCSGFGPGRSRRGRCSGPGANVEPERRVLRLFGVSESAVAKALADAGGDGDGVEATICARDFEIHVDLSSSRAGGPGGHARAGVRRAARSGISWSRRAISAGARGRAVPRAGPHARRGGIMHGWASSPAG